MNCPTDTQKRFRYGVADFKHGAADTDAKVQCIKAAGRNASAIKDIARAGPSFSNDDIKNIGERIFDDALHRISKAEEEGKSAVYVPVFSLERFTPEWFYDVAYSVKERLENEGFTARILHNEQRPIKKEPEFSFVVHKGGIAVSLARETSEITG